MTSIDNRNISKSDKEVDRGEAQLPVCVVVPTLDAPDRLEACLRCLTEQTYESATIRIADSGTGANRATVDSFRDELPIVHQMMSKSGLPRARNAALAEVDADIVAFCDEDARPVEGWVEALVGEFERSKVVGAVGGPILEPSQRLQHRETVAKVGDNGEVTANFDANHCAAVKHLRGTNMSFRTELLRELGGFDPAFTGTAHFEDTDATYAVHRVGKRVIYTPEAVVYHHHPMEEREHHRYYSSMLGNWPVLFEKTDPSALDRASFYARLFARWIYYSLELGEPVR